MLAIRSVGYQPAQDSERIIDMCLAIPARIESIDGQMAQVDMSGVQYTTSLVLTPDTKVGQYVIVHAGFALNLLDEAEAQETLELFQEMADLEKETPDSISEPS